MLSKSVLAALCASLLLMGGGGSVEAADPVLNWAQAPSHLNEGDGFAYQVCNRGGASSNCDRDELFNNKTEPDKTPWLQEAVSDGAGSTYFHTMIGLPGQAFVQEIYIKRQPCFNNHDSIACSSAGGSQVLDTNSTTGTGNGWDPLNGGQTFTGNGTGDPTKVIMQQVLTTSEMTQTYLKASFSKKPKITQTIDNSDLTATFVLDMTNSDYLASTTADNNTPGVMTNKLTLIGPNAPAGGDFDATSPATNFMTANTQAAHVTGGNFTFAPAAGWTSMPTYVKGTYTYSENGNFNASVVDWQAYRNKPDNLINFGSGPIQRAKSGNICHDSVGQAGCAP